MNIFAKLFNVNGHQVLIRKTTAEEDDSSKCVPAVIFEMHFEHVDVVNSFTYETEELRDKAFNEVFHEEQVTQTALKFIQICN